jgi:hypothetical protein
MIPTIYGLKLNEHVELGSRCPPSLHFAIPANLSWQKAIPFQNIVMSPSSSLKDFLNKLAQKCFVGRVVNIGSGIGTDSIADSDTQYRISIGGTFKKRVPEGYRGGIDRYSDTDTSSVIIVCHYSLSYNKK